MSAGACLMAGATMIALASPEFTLDWTHSVERIIWHEDWRIAGNMLVLTEAAVQGSGAGMEAGDGAVLRNGWWRWQPALPPLPELVLAASGATGDGWHLCDHAGGCHLLAAQPGEALHLRPCP